MAESLKRQTVRGTVWSFVESFSVQTVTFIVQIMMARVLTPADYGLTGMIAIFIAISQSLVDSGFSQALIRKQDRTQVDNSTVFFFNICIGAFLYLLLFIFAPLIARFYGEPLLVTVTRFMSISLIINSLIVVQRALLFARVDFKTVTKASLTSVIISGAIGIYMAYTNFGYWSIIVYYLANLGINMILLSILAKWRPSWVFSWQSFKELFGFGSKLAASGIINTLYKNIYLLVIGKVFRAADLGYYIRAQHFADYPSANMTTVMERVTYPILCRIQDDTARLQSVYRRIIRISAYVIFPMMTVLSALATPLILLFLRQQWLFTAELLSILCFAMMWYPIHAINLNLLKVKGRSDLFLKLEIYKKIISVVILCISVPFGLVLMCVAAIINSILSLIINTYYTGKMINVGFWRQMRDILPILLLSLFTGASVYLTILYFNLHPALSLAVGAVEAIIIYLGLSKMFKFNELAELISMVRERK
ncbi:MAG: lipopolysaccharide biosynthesis protein [Muribaculaceae bacterium]|nr:lipopolysaccharide biosynthesis protein [Muribaculaceae bacterium]